jgi:hypothetical protein
MINAMHGVSVSTFRRHQETANNSGPGPTRGSGSFSQDAFANRSSSSGGGAATRRTAEAPLWSFGDMSFSVSESFLSTWKRGIETEEDLASVMALISCFRTLPVIHALHVQLLRALETRVRAVDSLVEDRYRGSMTVVQQEKSGVQETETFEWDGAGRSIATATAAEILPEKEPYSAAIGALFVEFAPLFALHETFAVHYNNARVALEGTAFLTTMRRCGPRVVDTMHKLFAHVQVRLPTYAIMLTRLLKMLPECEQATLSPAIAHLDGIRKAIEVEKYKTASGGHDLRRAEKKKTADKVMLRFRSVDRQANETAPHGIALNESFLPSSTAHANTTTTTNIGSLPRQRANTFEGGVLRRASSAASMPSLSKRPSKGQGGHGGGADLYRSAPTRGRPSSVFKDDDDDMDCTSAYRLGASFHSGGNLGSACEFTDASMLSMRSRGNKKSVFGKLVREGSLVTQWKSSSMKLHFILYELCLLLGQSAPDGSFRHYRTFSLHDCVLLSMDDEDMDHRLRSFMEDDAGVNSAATSRRGLRSGKTTTRAAADDPNVRMSNEGSPAVAATAKEGAARSSSNDQFKPGLATQKTAAAAALPSITLSFIVLHAKFQSRTFEFMEITAKSAAERQAWMNDLSKSITAASDLLKSQLQLVEGEDPEPTNATTISTPQEHGQKMMAGAAGEVVASFL